MQINEHILKLTGKVCIPEALEMSHNYKTIIDGNITTITEEDNQNGTINRYYKFEPILCSIQKDNGEIIKGKDTRKESQKLRSKIYMIWQSNNNPLPFDDFYQKVLMNMRLNAEEIIENYIK